MPSPGAAAAAGAIVEGREGDSGGEVEELPRGRAAVAARGREALDLDLIKKMNGAAKVCVIFQLFL